MKWMIDAFWKGTNMFEKVMLISFLAATAYWLASIFLAVAFV